MTREHVVELFLGATADAPTREAARARLHWISENVLGPRALITGDETGALAILLARPTLETIGRVHELDAAAGLLAEQDERIRARVAFTTAWPEGQVDSLIAAQAIIPQALTHLRSGGRLVLAAPLGATTLGAVAVRFREHLAPEALFLRGGFVCFRGRRDDRARAAWDAWEQDGALAAAAEEGALDLQRLYEARLGDLDASRRALIASSAKRGRLLERSMRDALEQNVRLREQVDRTRRSARYRLGSAFVSAAKPSAETLKLPLKILEIYRAKAGGRAGEEADDGDLEPRRRLLEERLDKFAHEARVARAPWVAVIYTGTRIDGVRANRPFALARVLRERGVPVIFGYHGTIADAELPVFSDPLMLELPEEFLAARLDKIAALDFFEKKKLFLVAYPMPVVARAINQFNARSWVTIYDALDDWQEFARASVSNWFSASVEKYLVANADLTTAVSRPLVKKLALHADAPKVSLSANALDPAFVDAEYSRRENPEKKIGYFGHLTPAWFDWSALALVAKKRPDYRFEIIGYGAPAELDLPPNIRLLGPKDRREICRIAEEWSAAIIPFKIGPLADAVDPIKVYEYLALGLPVVSFRMPQIADYPATETVLSVDDFVAALDRALEQRPDPSELQEFLEDNTWSRRVDALLASADAVIAKRPFEKTLSRGPA